VPPINTEYVSLGKFPTLKLYKRNLFPALKNAADSAG
jgi:hypothetical protein